MLETLGALRFGCLLLACPTGPDHGGENPKVAKGQFNFKKHQFSCHRAKRRRISLSRFGDQCELPGRPAFFFGRQTGRTLALIFRKTGPNGKGNPVRPEKFHQAGKLRLKTIDRSQAGPITPNKVRLKSFYDTSSLQPTDCGP